MVLAGWGVAHLTVDDDVRHQQSLSSVLTAQQTEVKRLTGFGQTTQFFVVEGSDEQLVLRREEELGTHLADAVSAHALGGWQSVAQFVPSLARQQENRDLVERKLRQPYLAQLRDQLGLTVAADDPDQPLLTVNQVLATGALPLVNVLTLDQSPSHVLHLVMLNGLTTIDQVKAAAAGVEGVQFVDPTADISDLLTAYRHRAVWLLALSSVLMVPLLSIRYRLNCAVRIMLPPVATILLTPAILAILGQSFTFFSAMALVMILSIGVDYNIFCAEENGRRDPVTLFAVALAMSTALLSFGLMAASEVAGVRSFGMTMAVGIPLAFVLAPWTGRARKQGDAT